MATDVLLDEGPDATWVVIDSGVLKSTASDLILDAPRRRKNNRRLRRALVHDETDGLTINFNRDYPGGVTINDVVALTNFKDGLTIQGVAEIGGVATTLQPKAGGSGGGGGGKSTMLLRGNLLIEVPAALHATVRSEKALKRAARQVVSLQTLLETLNGEIQRLSRRVAQLERNASPPKRRARTVKT